MQEGKYVGKVIKARLAGAGAAAVQVLRQGHDGHDRPPVAVADAFGVKFTGFIAYLMWGFIHVLYLVGWGNRLGTIYTWARALWFSHNRGHRIITFESAREDLAEGRTASGRPAPILPSTTRAVGSPATDPPRTARRSG